MTKKCKKCGFLYLKNKPCYYCFTPKHILFKRITNNSAECFNENSYIEDYYGKKSNVINKPE
jgi:hypothetical protein